MLPFVRPALAALLHAALALSVLAVRLPQTPVPVRLAELAGLVAVVVGGIAAYTSGWIARTRSITETLVRGAVVGFSGAVNLGLAGYLLTRTDLHRLGTMTLAFAVGFAGAGLATGALAAYLHRRWSQ